ncbi:MULTISPECIES: glycosyltransferase family 2 protein [unclassified Chryseobacterium]|uniref:glycosyltransferase family 2 protein n=1 Tax=unclassified Chryseobacterium TaxID=2593645 RepID=UPI00100B4EAB|nr:MULTISPECIES: glycosyltransferase [unclassified Chryseobacterium]RXM53219.1 glycosyl transferase family 2 [Chryseobacterium sp. CH25]RXM65586.1 glycosyl transferase family 2 [Chryseobacterium sp. CH1]
MKKISILIANYNNGKYFPDCFASLMNQTYNNWEAIIVDDCSTDNSLEIIRELIKDDGRFLLLQNSLNKGCGFTKRKCVEHANGDICAFLDPDDALHPKALEESIIPYHSTSNIVATYSKMMLCDEKLTSKEIFSSTKQIVNDRYFFNCPIQFAHFFTFRKDIYLKTSGINPNLKSAVDQDLYLKILELGEVKFIKKVLYKYRLHDGGISQHTGKKAAKNSFALIIHETMKRRNINYINHCKVPEDFTDADEIFSFLNYQTELSYRLKMKLKLLFGL